MRKFHTMLGLVFFSTLTLSTVLSTSSHAGPWERVFRMKFEKAKALSQEAGPSPSLRWLEDALRATQGGPADEGAATEPAPVVTTDFFEQSLDHSLPLDPRKFRQRFHVNSSYAESKLSPVFFHVCGEAECTAGALRGALEEYAKLHKAHLVALEHRYYGKSQPFTTLSTENLKYLTIENALEDLAVFQRAMMKKNGWKGKWIAVGGSYPGSLAAYYRQKHPELVVGAWASSAPVQADEDFDEYDRHIGQEAGPECLAAIRQSVTKIEAVLDQPEQLAELKAKFQAQAIVEPVDFLYLVADMAALAVQYGGREYFCKLMTESADPLDGYAEYTRFVFKEWDMDALSMSFQVAMNESVDAHAESIGMRQWFYQSCTEYGYWQNASKEEAFRSRSLLINLDYHRNVCKRLFGLEMPAQIERTNARYYEPLLDASTTRIFFSNGSSDPWSTLSITGKNGNHVNPALDSVLIQGAAHCDDLGTPRAEDSEALKQSRELWSIRLADWLK